MRLLIVVLAPLLRARRQLPPRRHVRAQLKVILALARARVRSRAAAPAMMIRAALAVRVKLRALVRTRRVDGLGVRRRAAAAACVGEAIGQSNVLPVKR